MANSKVFLSDLKSGKCSSRVQVRLLRFWEVRIVRCGGELISVDMLLLDSKATLIPAPVNASHFSRFMVRVQLSPSSPRRLRRDLRRLMGSQLWEEGVLLDIILSRGGKYKEEDAKILMIQIL
ncbi:hypothetical protein Bca4012_081915 [Brassica carinata]